MNYVNLNNNLKVPQIGIGTYKVENIQEITNLIEYAVKANYEMLDTASYYNNENLIGEVFKNNPELKKHFLVSSKVWPSDFDKDNTKRSIENSLNNLNLDKIDIMFIHWPSEGFLEAWKVFEDYYEQGVLKSIAVCNFQIKYMEKLLVHANIPPSINQVELHPYLVQEELSDYLKKSNIKIQAWAPLGRASKEMFNEKILVELAKKYNKSVAQIILRWHIDKGHIIIPKSTKESRINENINIFDFSLELEEIKLIDKLNRNHRFSQNPDDEEWLTKIRKGLK
ncbi:aldo/keto reductase [Miniphocaeibacter halophilus]|uniref:Aldo/keto reductase n=1 Tax=Miniphocaeibacter halophilus TaxID=2931922 RepID=A0AC61MQ01_9FIRM|nr:aldo/keto reductase [Miniphocaeibacter halophilus]QQK07378.1 aldo/keto reductase [Miniphocaeibacter halophilus]